MSSTLRLTHEPITSTHLACQALVLLLLVASDGCRQRWLPNMCCLCTAADCEWAAVSGFLFLFAYLSTTVSLIGLNQKRFPLSLRLFPKVIEFICLAFQIISLFNHIEIPIFHWSRNKTSFMSHVASTRGFWMWWRCGAELLQNIGDGVITIFKIFGITYLRCPII